MNRPPVSEPDRPVHLDQVIAVLERHYPPRAAESWDQVGLVVGDPDRPVRRMLLAVDVTDAVLAQAVEVGAELIVAHHPLLLRGLHAVTRDQPKGRLILTAARHDVAIYAAHTNADKPARGVSAALADRLGLRDCRPLEPDQDRGGDERPDEPAGSGLGRVGSLPEPMTAADFAALVADRLPATVTGVRLAGDPDRLVRRVALLGGAGDSMLEQARASGAEVYLTSDLRHHPASEAIEWADAPVLVDVAHWAAEWTWLPVLAELLAEELPGVDRVISDLRTDPWTLRVDSPQTSGPAT